MTQDLNLSKIETEVLDCMKHQITENGRLGFRINRTTGPVCGASHIMDCPYQIPGKTRYLCCSYEKQQTQNQ